MQLHQTWQRVAVEGLAFDSLAQADLQLQAFKPSLLGVELLPRRRDRLAAADEGDVALRRADVPEPAPLAMRMGGAAEALIVPLVPVDEVCLLYTSDAADE